jgi:hypothetical protein
MARFGIRWPGRHVKEGMMDTEVSYVLEMQELTGEWTGDPDSEFDSLEDAENERDLHVADLREDSPASLYWKAVRIKKVVTTTEVVDDSKVDV